MEKTSRFLFVFLFVMASFSMAAQQKTITGTVTSAGDGGPLPGANVIVESDTGRGALTDFDGNYAIDAAEGETLVFSFIGMKTVSVTVGSSDVINVSLEEDAAQLDEVVVTALGVSREKKALGYAVSELSSDEINTVKSANVAESIVGKVAGVVVNESGGLGSGSRIVIRGNNSLMYNNRPLVLVDGIPIEDKDSQYGRWGGSDPGTGINDINPTSVAAPFGGIKDSGMGREGATEGIEEYLEVKSCGFSI